MSGVEVDESQINLWSDGLKSLRSVLDRWLPEVVSKGTPDGIKVSQSNKRKRDTADDDPNLVPPKKRHCSRCKKEGHNKATCREEL